MKIMPLRINLVLENQLKRKCAQMMSKSEPWITLKRDYEECAKLLCDSEKEIYVAFDDNEPMILGFAVINMHGAFRGYIQSILINAEYRRNGLGTELLTYCENRIFRESPNVFICVSSFNEEAAKLYFKSGYVKVGELRDYIVDGFSEILLRKTISPISAFRRVQKIPKKIA